MLIQLCVKASTKVKVVARKVLGVTLAVTIGEEAARVRIRPMFTLLSIQLKPKPNEDSQILIGVIRTAVVRT